MNSKLLLSLVMIGLPLISYAQSPVFLPGFTDNHFRGTTAYNGYSENYESREQGVGQLRSGSGTTFASNLFRNAFYNNSSVQTGPALAWVNGTNYNFTLEYTRTTSTLALTLNGSTSTGVFSGTYPILTNGTGNQNIDITQADSLFIRIRSTQVGTTNNAFVMSNLNFTNTETSASTTWNNIGAGAALYGQGGYSAGDYYVVPLDGGANPNFSFRLTGTIALSYSATLGTSTQQSNPAVQFKMVNTLTKPVSAPEPGSLALLALGIGCYTALRPRRFRKRSGRSSTNSSRASSTVTIP
jgi:hypothetical protein